MSIEFKGACSVRACTLVLFHSYAPVACLHPGERLQERCICHGGMDGLIGHLGVEEGSCTSMKSVSTKVGNSTNILGYSTSDVKRAIWHPTGL